MPNRPTGNRTGMDLVYWLEDNYSDYRRDVENRLCKDDPAIHDRFNVELAEARKLAKAITHKGDSI